MAWRRKDTEREGERAGPMLGNIHEWILSLPWVVERPYGVGTPGVRSFAVDCEPLDLRQLWLVTGLTRTGNGERALGAAVIVPTELAEDFETVGLAHRSRRCPPDES